MNRRKYAGIVYGGGLAIIVLVVLSAIPILMADFSWRAVGIMFGALLAGLGNMLVGRLMRKLP